LTAFLLMGGTREISWSSTLPYVAMPCGYANRLYLFDPFAGKLMSTLQVFWACVPSWSPDGQLLACGIGKSRVQVWRVSP
jgi:WD40 repeat protein